MRYALRIAADARSDLIALDPWSQEGALDELEMISDDPSILPTAGPEGDIVYSFDRSIGETKCYFTAVLALNDMGHTLTLLGISIVRSVT